MKVIGCFIKLFLGEIILILFCIIILNLYGNNLFNYFVDMVPIIGVIVGTFIVLLISGLLKYFGKAFILVLKTDIEVDAGKKACLALQCAMISAVVWSVFVTIIGVVAAQNGLFLESMEDFAVANINALCAAQPGVGVLIVLLLCPLYFRIKRLIMA